jgi:hypothetical protein
MTLRIDTDRSLAAARQWLAWGDELDRAQFELRRVGADDDPPGAAWVAWRMGAAASELWVAGSFLRLVVERVESADRLDPAAVGELLRRSGAVVIDGACAAPALVAAPQGDAGGTFRAELRSPYAIDAVDDVEAGRQLVMRALADSATPGQIRPDEFEIVNLADGRHLVVLPGVIDLSRHPWWVDTASGSVRDLDRHAVPSSRSAAVADNAYAEMVWQALLARQVPLGSELVIVGHSFGADTALDLAADGRFNGPGGFEVSHVVAAGYASGPQLRHVPSETRVLVLENRRDLLVIAEAIGQAHVVETGYAATELADAVARLDGPAALDATRRTLAGAAGAALAAGSHLIDRSDDVSGLAGGLLAADRRRVAARLTDLATPEPRIDQATPSQLVVVFDGGGTGAGHHQDNYVEYLTGVGDPSVAAFLASLAGARSLGGTAWAVDVSEPR